MRLCGGVCQCSGVDGVCALSRGERWRQCRSSLVRHCALCRSASSLHSTDMTAAAVCCYVCPLLSAAARGAYMTRRAAAGAAPMLAAQVPARRYAALYASPLDAGTKLRCLALPTYSQCTAAQRWAAQPLQRCVQAVERVTARTAQCAAAPLGLGAEQSTAGRYCRAAVVELSEAGTGSSQCRVALRDRGCCAVCSAV